MKIMTFLLSELNECFIVQAKDVGCEEDHLSGEEEAADVISSVS